jgi:ZIP family zinc transporter
MVLLLGLATMISTLLGGLVALKFQDRLHLVLGFSAGSVVGLAFFDLLPESILMSGPNSVPAITSLIALGFIVYMLLDRISVFHGHRDEHPNEHEHHGGRLGAATLCFHSLVDGIAIGLAFQIGPRLGLLIALAVLLHDFSDGINTVNILVHHSAGNNSALRWLSMDALAPLVGTASTLFFSLPQAAFAKVLAVLCGFFFYIGATDLLPESQHGHPTRFTTLMTLLGMGMLYIAATLAPK